MAINIIHKRHAGVGEGRKKEHAKGFKTVSRFLLMRNGILKKLQTYNVREIVTLYLSQFVLF